MRWYEITVYTTDAGTEYVCGALTSAGFSGFSIEESKNTAAAFLRESALYWDFADMDKIGTDLPCVRCYAAELPENEPMIEAAKAAVERLRTLNLDVDLGSLVFQSVVRDEEDWANNWKQYYKPLEIGSRLLVLPSWEPKPETDRTILKLDPGLAFGTGSHPTTHMCLEYLEELVRPGDKVADLGCGSGILSIAASLLGAEKTVAVDIDPIAESIARENAEMNGLSEERYTIEIGDILKNAELCRKIDDRYDIVVANIVADVISMLSPYAKTICRNGGYYLVSGIIDTRKDEIYDRLTSLGFEVLDVFETDGWVAMKAVNRG